MTTIRIEGLAELQARMRTLPKRLQQRALSASMRAGARVVQQEIKSRAPVATGALRRNVVTKRGRSQFDQGLAGRQIVGVRHGKIRTRPTQVQTRSGKMRTRKLSAYDRKGVDPFYFRFQELGFTAVGRRKAASRSERRARKLGTGGGRWIPGKRFMRDGLTAAGPRALEAIRGRLARELDRFA